jgi:hypothetical protein
MHHKGARPAPSVQARHYQQATIREPVAALHQEVQG